MGFVQLIYFDFFNWFIYFFDFSLEIPMCKIEKFNWKIENCHTNLNFKINQLKKPCAKLKKIHV